MAKISKFLSPKELAEYYIANNLNKLEVINLLFSIIEECGDGKIRAEYIKLFDDLHLHNKKVFQFLEHLLISDENSVVRATSAKLIMRKYPNEMLLPIKWTIQKDKSFLVLTMINKHLSNVNNEVDDVLIKELSARVQKIADNYGLVQQEALFLMDIGFDEVLYKDTRTSNRFNIIYGNNNIMCAVRNGYIRALSISSWTPESLPKSIGNLSKLRYLNLSCNDLTLLPESMESLSRLRYLDLGWNEFTTIPNFLAKVNSIRYLRLDLDHNEIETIPKFVKKLKQLKYLNLKSNKIKKIPISIGLLKNLEVLDLRENEIETIPYSIGLLTSLKELLLSHNKIISLPNTITQLKSLEVLDLAYNNINDFPKEIYKLKNLRSLNLKNNNITDATNS
ncbi:MAG: leucine-rich repeat domain-containing protein [Candidatus Hermodarchaeota archaeon]